MVRPGLTLSHPLTRFARVAFGKGQAPGYISAFSLGLEGRK